TAGTVRPHPCARARHFQRVDTANSSALLLVPGSRSARGLRTNLPTTRGVASERHPALPLRCKERARRRTPRLEPLPLYQRGGAGSWRNAQVLVRKMTSTGPCTTSHQAPGMGRLVRFIERGESMKRLLLRRSAGGQVRDRSPGQPYLPQVAVERVAH